MMTLVEIMARSVGARPQQNKNCDVEYLLSVEALEQLIELARADAIAAEREKLAAWMIQRGYSTGHGNTTKDLLDELDWQVVQNWSSAMKTGVETEREACAKYLGDQNTAITDKLAAQIRARSKD